MNIKASSVAAFAGLMLGSVSSSFASDVSPFCKFSTDPSGTIFGSRYDLAKAYQASDLVVVGKVIRSRALQVLLRHIDKGRHEGKYHEVDGDGNDACPNIFPVEGNRAIVGKQRVDVGGLRRFLEQVRPIGYP